MMDTKGGAKGIGRYIPFLRRQSGTVKKTDADTKMLLQDPQEDDINENQRKEIV